MCNSNSLKHLFKMSEIHHHEELSLISNGLHRTVNGVIGPECIIKVRRMKFEMNDAFVHCNTSIPLMNITSGSLAEGFNFQTSDVDIMTMDEKVIVLNNTLIQSNSIGVPVALHNTLIQSNSIGVPSVLTMDSENVSPGFTLLKCLNCDIKNWQLFNSLVLKGNGMYVSSRIVRESHMLNCPTIIHGPCRSGDLLGLEYDFAYTLKCQTWPKQAIPFIHRSLRYGWPVLEVLTDICKDGCLMVPINSKQQTCKELMDVEWRISFSIAEKKLIHSMNHCQFLCYGLMKIFLKEVLKKIPEIGDLLCSYFMKTAVFWEITENTENWSQSNFMLKFLNVLTRLIKWVSIGYCPNFFISENNMFFGKIHGRQQTALLARLRSLHNEGYLCLLRCPSLHETLSLFIGDPSVVNFMSQYECDYVPATTIESEKVKTIYFISGIPTEGLDFDVMARTLCDTAALTSTSHEMTSALKLRMNFIIQRMAEILCSSRDVSNCTSNKSRYSLVKTGQSILRRTKTFFCLNKIYLAECAYINGDYLHTIQIVDYIKSRLQNQHYMHVRRLDGNLIIKCRQLGMSYDAIIKTFTNSGFEYKPETSIEELHLESGASEEDFGHDTLFIPPLVYVDFLLILTYTRLNDVYSRNVILGELYSLLHCDNGYHIYHLYKAISWEILGICQQLCGDYYVAYQSYVNALYDENNGFVRATKFRICSLF